MKSIKLSVFLTLFVSAIFGEGHSSTIHLNVNPTSIKNSHLKGYHQYCGKINENTYFLASGLYSPYFLKGSHHLEGAFGLRKFFDELGIGLNLGYSINNHSGRFASQFSPGIEFFYDQFQFFGNHYAPLKFERKIGNLNVVYPHVTEVGFHYLFKDKYEFGLIPYYNHSIGKMGINAHLGVFILENFEAVVRPHFSPLNKGVSISFNYHFGPKKTGRNQPIRKNSDLFQSAVKMKKISERKPPVSLPINLIEPQRTIEIIKEEIEVKVEVVEEFKEVEVIDVQPAATQEKKPDITWTDFFFRALGRV